MRCSSSCIFGRLRANAARYAPAARLYECALGESEGRARFTFYPRASAMSGRHAEAGPLALVVPTGWQIAWLVVLGVFALSRRTGASWRAPGARTPPPDPAGA